MPPKNSVSLPPPRLRLATRLRWTSELAERQIRDYAAAAATRIQNDLVRAAEHTFHGFEVHTLAGDVRGLFVLVIDFQEPRRLAGCFGHRLRLVGLCSLRDLRHPAACFRHDAVSVGLRLVNGALKIGARGLNIAESIDHLCRRIDLLQRHLLYYDSSAIMIEGLLHQIVNGRLDGLPRAGENRLDLGTPNHLAHGAFGHRLHRAFRILNVEEEFADVCRLHFPQNREIDIDDVLVAGEHQALLPYITHGWATAADIVNYTHADVDLVHTQRLGREHGLDRIWQMVAQARLDLAHFLAEAQHDAQLIRLDAGKSGESPERDYTKKDESETASAKIAAGQHPPQFVLAATEDFLQIRRRRPGRLRPGTPGALATAAPGPIAALIGPRH